jgi:hypothetical protein
VSRGLQRDRLSREPGAAVGVRDRAAGHAAALFAAPCARPRPTEDPRSTLWRPARAGQELSPASRPARGRGGYCPGGPPALRRWAPRVHPRQRGGGPQGTAPRPLWTC